MSISLRNSPRAGINGRFRGSDRQNTKNEVTGGRTVTQFYAGFDTSIYPGDGTMEWLLKNTNLKWTGFYLGPAPTHGDTTWMPKYTSLKSMGWGFAPVYVGQQMGSSSLINGPQGTIDAKNAASLAQQAQIPLMSTLFLDIEMGGPLPREMVQYYSSWCAQVKICQYNPGLYCSHYQTAAQLSAVFQARVWNWNISVYPQPADFKNNYPELNPALSGYPSSCCWQLLQNLSIPVNGQNLKVDLDSARMPDPSSA